MIPGHDPIGAAAGVSGTLSVSGGVFFLSVVDRNAFSIVVAQLLMSF